MVYRVTTTDDGVEPEDREDIGVPEWGQRKIYRKEHLAELRSVGAAVWARAAAAGSALRSVGLGNLTFSSRPEINSCKTWLGLRNVVVVCLF